MSDRWIDQPRQSPYKCYRTGASGLESGPYFEHDAFYFDAKDPDINPQGTGRWFRLYQSKGDVERVLSAPGSPFAPVDMGEWNRTRVRVHELELEVEQARAEIDQLRVELAEARVPRIDADALLKAVDTAGMRVAKKPGPKPKAAA